MILCEGIKLCRTRAALLFVLLWIDQICCTVTNRESIPLPEPPHCGIDFSDRISGQVTRIDEFPWTALIEYQKPDGSVSFGCEGSLINERYIVTAAHCVESIPLSWKPYRVRLGEWDKALENDCEDGYCSNTIDLDIDQIVVHNNYNKSDRSHAHDIALIRFTTQANYSDTVKPICLPLSDSLRKRNHAGIIAYAAGWHENNPAMVSEVKRKVQLNVTSTEECSKIYTRVQISLKPTQMCAQTIRRFDTCPGDSGGPLMRQLSGVWYQIGVFSFGPKSCTGIRHGVPAVYTNVSEYVDWIKDNMN